MLCYLKRACHFCVMIVSSAWYWEEGWWGVTESYPVTMLVLHVQLQAPLPKEGWGTMAEWADEQEGNGLWCAPWRCM